MLTIRFSQTSQADSSPAYQVELDSPLIGQARGAFSVPYTWPHWSAIQQALEPGFQLDLVDGDTRALLHTLGEPSHWLAHIGDALTAALLTDPTVATHFSQALSLAASQRVPLPVELRFGENCDAIAALPWELLRSAGHFLVADTTIALSRYPEGLLPPTPVLAELPLRVLLVLSKPLDAPPIFPDQARDDLLHGLRTLDEVGAVLVDLLRPPTFDTLVEALRNGHYHWLIFYGHGVHTAAGGHLLFEDEFGAGALVRAADLGAALRNTEVRLVLLGACQSATVTLALPSASLPASESIWRGTAAALVRAGVPLAIGMQVSMRVDAAQAFMRQFALSLAAGKPVLAAVADARLPLLQTRYGESWFIPALYGRPAGEGQAAQRLFDPAQALPEATADLRLRLQQTRATIADLERTVASVGLLGQAGDIARLRQARQQLAATRFQLAQRTPGGYAVVTSPLYGVPSNPVFVGRRDELIQVGRALKQRLPVVIWGAGGLGKTALAQEIAQRQSWRYPAGVLWLDCRGGPALDTLLEHLAAFCGLGDLSQIQPAEKTSVVRSALARLEQRCLLIWDNAEDIWPQAPVRHFIRHALPPNCQALLTTRDNPEETAWPVIELAPLASAPMTTLFGQLAERANVKLPSAANVDLIPAIITWLQGHPLALTLIIPLAAKRGLARVWQDLQAHPLKGIAAAFTVSYERLTGDQQRLFMRLSVFTIPFAYETAVALLPAAEQTSAAADTIADLLDTLVQRALIQFDGAHYAYHALLRQYAYARLQEREDTPAVHALAAAYLQAKASVTPNEALEEVDQWAQTSAWATFVERASALVGSLDRQGYWAAIEARLIRAQHQLAAHASAPSARQAQLLNARGMLADKRSEWDKAISFYQQALHTTEQVGNLHGMAQTYNNLGLVYHDKGEWGTAISYYQQALHTTEQLGDVHGMAQTLGNLGNVYQAKGEWDKAISFYQQALHTMQQIGDVHGMANTYNNLGAVYKAKGEWDKAISFYQQSLHTTEQVGDLHGMALTLGNLGVVYDTKGEWDKAISFYQQSLHTTEQVGDVHGMALTLGNLGVVYKAKGEWDKAISFYQQALHTTEQVGDLHGMALTYNNLGLVYQAKGEWDKAISFYQQALHTMQQVGDVHGMAQTYNNLGVVYQAKGEWDKAISFYEQALHTMQQIGDVHGMAQTYNNLGAVYKAKGEWDKAITFYQQSLHTSEQLGDVHGMALTLGNLGLFYQAQGKVEQAAHYMARAYRHFAHLGAAETQPAVNDLVNILGSVAAANQYLAQLDTAADETDAASAAQAEDNGVTLDQLLTYVTQACQGDTPLAAQLTPWLQALATDPNQPVELQTLAQVLTSILAGVRTPDLTALPPHLAAAIHTMLATLTP